MRMLLCYPCHVAYALMWRNMKEVARPWRSPLGMVGAALGCIIFLLCIIGFLVYGTGVWQAALLVVAIYALWMAYYYFVSRFHVGISPEDRFALQLRVTAERMLASNVGYYYLYHACDDMARAHEANGRTAQLALDCWKRCQQALDEANKKKRAKLILFIYDTYLSKFTAKDGLPIDRSALSAQLFNWVRRMRTGQAQAQAQGNSSDTSAADAAAQRDIEQLLRDSQTQVMRVLNKVAMPYFYRSNAFEQFIAKEPMLGK